MVETSNITLSSYNRVEFVDLTLYNCAPINFVLYYDRLGSPRQTSKDDTKEQIRAVKPQQSSTPAQFSVIIDGE